MSIPKFAIKTNTKTYKSWEGKSWAKQEKRKDESNTELTEQGRSDLPL